jgi:SAM-dependent methyltransferase
MQQSAIWDHFQNEGVASFSGAAPRLRWLAAQVGRGEKVMNIGIGNGDFERAAALRGATVYTLDPSARAVERIRDELALGDRALIGRSEAIPLADGVLDVVVMSEVLEHLGDAELAATLTEVARVLRPGGRFLGTVPANEDMVGNEVVCPGCHTKFHRWGHVRGFDKSSLGMTLTGGGFVGVGTHTRAFPDFRRRGARIRSAVRFVLGRLGQGVAHPNLVFVARKP